MVAIRSINIKAILCLLFLFTTAPFAYGQIINSRHDLRFRVGTDELCIICHAPHGGAADAPLWNHTLSQENYIPYASLSLDAQDVEQPDGASKACLSCHDGTVKLDSYGGQSGSMGSGFWGFKNLKAHHPISFVYDAALAAKDGGLKDPSESSGLGKSIAEDLLFDGKIQCATCHDIHVARPITHGTFLRIGIKNKSELCRTCHVK